MKKRICFFTRGFAFNRLIRMQFHEKIFPKDVEIYLVTTNKYDKYPEKKWKLSRTKVVVMDYNPLTFPFKLRKFCKEKKIDRMITVGSSFGGLFLIFATLFTKTDYIENLFTHVFYRLDLPGSIFRKIRTYLDLLLYYPLFSLAKKATFNELNMKKKAQEIFFISPDKTFYLPAPVNEKKFKIKSKTTSRKKLKISKRDKVVINVGRVNYAKGSDILGELIKKNKDITFLVIGKINDPNFPPKSTKNLIHLERVDNEKLADYYNAADFSFCINRGGGGLGISTEEALSCGIPSIILRKWEVKDSPALFKTKPSVKEANKVLKKFFSKSNEERKKLAKEARNFVLDNYSYKALKKEYTKVYLG